MTQPGHLSEYLRVLKELDNKRVTVTIESPVREDDAEFDRKVRRSLDRQHRRQRISQ